MSKKPKKQITRPAKPSAKSVLGVSAGTLVTMLIGTISFVLLFGWNGLMPLLTVPLAVGLFVGLMATSLIDAALVGGSVGLLGSLLASAFYRPDAFFSYLEKTNRAAIADITGSLWQGFVVPLITSNPVNDPHVGPFVVVGVAAVVTPAIAAGTWWAVARLAPKFDRRWLGLGVILLLGVCLYTTQFVNGKEFVRSVSVEPAAESYAFDGVVNLKAYYLVRGGMNYYDAIITAAAGDTRINDVKNGKWGADWGISSPTRVREPAVFYLWAAVGHSSASGVLGFSLLLAIVLWAVWYWALFPILGQRALFSAFALFPLFTVHMAWYNLFHPDWWAAMMLMYSAAFLVRKFYVTSAVFAFLMVVFRELFVFYLFAVIIAAVVLWLRKKLAGRDVAAYGTALLAFVVAYAAHYFAEAPYLSNALVKEGTLSYIMYVSTKPFELKFMGPTSYLMFPYGDAVIPAFVLMGIGAVGLFFMLKGSDLARFALPGYIVGVLVFLVIIGASSSYWGQLISMPGIVGCAALLAGLDRLGKRFDGQAA